MSWAQTVCAVGTRSSKQKKQNGLKGMGRYMGISSRKSGPEGLHYPLVTELENCLISDLSALNSYQRFSTLLAVSCFKADSLPFMQCHDEIRPRLRQKRDGYLYLNSEALQPSGALHSQGSRDVPIPFNTVDLCQTVWCLVWTISTKTIMILCSGFTYCKSYFLRAATSFNKGQRRVENRCREGAEVQHTSLPTVLFLTC